MDWIEADEMKIIVSQVVIDEANQKLERQYQASETFKPIVDEIKKEVDEISTLTEDTKFRDEEMAKYQNQNKLSGKKTKTKHQEELLKEPEKPYSMITHDDINVYESFGLPLPLKVDTDGASVDELEGSLKETADLNKELGREKGQLIKKKEKERQ